ncbi:hypothetical protein RCL1_006854 [Eukaryota sp. TZLM3-RCL]
MAELVMAVDSSPTFERSRSLISTVHHFNKESLLEHTYSNPITTSDIHNSIYGRVGYGGGFKSHFRKKQEFDIDCSTVDKESLLEHTYSDPIITSDIHNSIYGRVGYGGGFKSHFRRRRSLISTIHHFNKESLLEHTYSDPVITSDIHNRIYGRVGYGGGFKSHFHCCLFVCCEKRLQETRLELARLSPLGLESNSLTNSDTLARLQLSEFNVIYTLQNR